MQPSPLIGKAPADGEDENRLLLHCAAPRGPALIAKWISYRVSNAERQDWRRGIEAAFRYREHEGHLQVPYGHTEGPYPRGRWLSEQRHACRTGTMTGERAAELEGLGVVWDTADHAFDQSLAAARAYHRLHGTLAAPRGAAILSVQIGQRLTTVRRPGGFGEDPVRAGRRAAALAAIDEDWNPRGAGVDGGLAAALRLPHPALGGRRPSEGRHRRGDPALRHIGRRLATQQREWNRLNTGQQARPGALGITPARVVRTRQTPAKIHVRAGRGSLPQRRDSPRSVPRQGRRRRARPLPGRASPRRE
ncbi:helicase associated domain-containing protein [Streptomyces lavendulae]|uniref:helicase associated domain-containing protein n=1 Tax=Streptomyces lavendulae TaxID=1914 RepID=UPI0033F3B44D